MDVFEETPYGFFSYIGLVVFLHHTLLTISLNQLFSAKLRKVYYLVGV